MWEMSVYIPVGRDDQMEDNSIARGRGRLRKAIGESIKKDLYFKDTMAG